LFDQIARDDPSSRLRRCQLWLIRTLGFCLPLVKGRGIFQYDLGLMPHRRPCTVVVGPPVEVPKEENPTDEVVDKYHALYCKALVELFDRNKKKFGGPAVADKQLCIVH